ncbi:MAG: radical SAM protein, partial [Candidatus Eisenbacteria bacterium]
MNVLLVSPNTPDTFWSYRHALPFIKKKAGHTPLGLLTVAAFLPETWNLKLVDLNVSRLSDDEIRWADYVMVSGMLIHRRSLLEVAGRCAALGRPVIAGGPLFTTSHETFPEIPHVVRGEAEDLMASLVKDMIAGRVRPLYEAAEKPDLRSVPPPRWDLIDFRDYACMSVQFCRGCPFDCEFCDIALLNGRKPRTKSPDQVVGELDALRAAGWKGSIFLVDDNFLGHKPRVRELLGRIIEWRERTGARVDFLTEASIDLAEEPVLLDLMVKAGFTRVFVGIESPDVENLRECNKLQNTRCDLAESVRKIHAAGLEVMGGFIIGFDGDTADIFQRQFEFIQRTGVVTAMVGLLNALPGTRLYRRLASEGRLLD